MKEWFLEIERVDSADFLICDYKRVNSKEIKEYKNRIQNSIIRVIKNQEVIKSIELIDVQNKRIGVITPTQILEESEYREFLSSFIDHQTIEPKNITYDTVNYYFEIGIGFRLELL